MIVSSNVWYTFFHILGMFQFLAWTNWSKITKCLSNKPSCWNNKALWCGEICNKIHINITHVHGLLLSQNHFQDEANIKWCSNDILQVQQSINCFVCENAERLKYYNIIKAPSTSAAIYPQWRLWFHRTKYTLHSIKHREVSMLYMCIQDIRSLHNLTGISVSDAAERPLTHWGRDQIDAFSQTTFSNAFSRMKVNGFCLGFHWRLFLRLELTIFQHWFR